MFTAVELAVVALLAASALALPLAGGRVEALTIGAIGIGHIVGSFISLPLWQASGGGVVGYALLFSGCSLAASALWWATEARLARDAASRLDAAVPGDAMR
jgi:hypothetical protein